MVSQSWIDFIHIPQQTLNIVNLVTDLSS
jgi:hypothetical protein